MKLFHYILILGVNLLAIPRTSAAEPRFIVDVEISTSSQIVVCSDDIDPFAIGLFDEILKRHHRTFISRANQTPKETDKGTAFTIIRPRLYSHTFEQDRPTVLFMTEDQAFAGGCAPLPQDLSVDLVRVISERQKIEQDLSSLDADYRQVVANSICQPRFDPESETGNFQVIVYRASMEQDISLKSCLDNFLLNLEFYEPTFSGEFDPFDVKTYKRLPSFLQEQTAAAPPVGD